VHAVRDRRKYGREDVQAGASRRVARLVRGHACPWRAALGGATPVPEGAGACDEAAAHRGQCVRAVAIIVPRGVQVRLVQRRPSVDEVLLLDARAPINFLRAPRSYARQRNVTFKPLQASSDAGDRCTSYSRGPCEYWRYLLQLKVVSLPASHLPRHHHGADKPSSRKLSEVGDTPA
jgi:hypothetical protein